MFRNVNKCLVSFFRLETKIDFLFLAEGAEVSLTVEVCNFRDQENDCDYKLYFELQLCKQSYMLIYCFHFAHYSRICPGFHF